MKNRNELLKTPPMILLTVIAIYGTFAGSTEPIVGWLRGTWLEPYLYKLHSGNSMLFNVAVGFLNSVVFWIMVVVYPERKRNKVLRENLRRRYQDFRENRVQTLVHAAGTSCSTADVHELTHYRNFKEYFDADNKSLWYAALNGLEDRPDRVDDLLLEMEMLADEVRYVLDKVSIDDERIHASFKALCENILRLRRDSNYSGDRVKYVGWFVWGTLAQWNFVEGQLNYDPILRLIESV